MRKINLLALFAGFILSVLTITAEEKTGSLLWKISGKGLSQPSYLLGTLHVAPGTILDSITGANEAFAACEQVVGELTMLDLMELTERIQEAGMMPPDTTYRMLYNEEEYRIVNNGITELLGDGLDKKATLKPAMLQTTVSLVLAKRHFPDFNPETSMDYEIQKKAMGQRKVISGLEGVDNQADYLYNTTPLIQQARTLLLIFRHMDDARKVMELLISSYCKGDLSTLGNVFFDNSNIKLIHRNNLWMEQLPALMEQRPCFVAVGVGHLPGEGGLLMQLERSGYTVEAVK